MDQVTAATAALGMADTPPMHCGNDDLYALDLSELSIPTSLQSGEVRCRLSSPEDLELLTAWRIAYCIEVLGDAHDSTLEREAEDLILKLHDQRNLWLLEQDGRRVAKTAFNARIPDCVQVGGVWTPPEERGRGFARAVVAGSLRDAREAGARRAILFTDNPAARKAYESIGFRKIGRYGFVLYSQPIPVRLNVAETAATRS
jgi:predicted GNAT family acetyltransferase